MILINKGAENIVVLTLKEKTTLATPTYLFEFKNDNSNVSQYFIVADTSEFLDRYNRFSITEGDGEDIELELTGYYNYTIREQASAVNLNPALSGAIVETGKVKVIGTETVNTKYDSQLKTNTVYNG